MDKSAQRVKWTWSIAPVPGDDVEIDLRLGEQSGSVYVIQQARLDIIGIYQAVATVSVDWMLVASLTCPITHRVQQLAVLVPTLLGRARLSRHRLQTT